MYLPALTLVPYLGGAGAGAGGGAGGTAGGAAGAAGDTLLQE